MVALVLVAATAAVSGWPQAGSGPSLRPVLTPQREIGYPAALRVPEGLQWAFAHMLAVEPDGNYVWALVPIPGDPKLHRREQAEEEGATGTKRVFHLQRIDLETGEVVAQGDFIYNLDRGEHSGFQLSPDGQHFCTLSDGKLLVLSLSFQVLHEMGTGLKAPDGEMLSALRCNFFPGTSKLLILYRPTPPGGIWSGEHWSYKMGRDLLMIYDWRLHRIVQVVPFPSWVEDAIPVTGLHAVVIQREPKWYYRHRIGRISLEDSVPEFVWDRTVREVGPQRIVLSEDVVFWTDRPWQRAIERMGYSPCPSSLLDCDENPYPRFPWITGKVRSSERGSGRKGKEYRLSGYWLHWPLTVSADGGWLAVRATHFTHTTTGHQDAWDDTRFVIFEVNGNPKKPRYVSENFGPEEAIVDLAFTPDGSTLIVATTARLIIYDVSYPPAAE